MTSLTELRGVGPKTQEKLAKLNIHSVEDLLFHLPSRYQDRTRITPVSRCHHGEFAVVEVDIVKTEVVSRGTRRILQCTATDSTGILQLVWFHFHPNQVQSLRAGVHLRCFGECRRLYAGLTISHPDYQVLQLGESASVNERLTPIYPLTAGFTQLQLRQLIQHALELQKYQDGIVDIFEDYCPESFPDLKTALEYCHLPPPDADVNALISGRDRRIQRLALEEWVAWQLAMLSLKEKIQHQTALPCQCKAELLDRFLAGLTFSLTNAQQRVCDEILTDLQSSIPMSRLVQGDVGSGKTVVAAIAALQALASGYQAAVMAPTEILAEQHYLQFQAWFEPLGFEVCYLSGKLSAKERNVILGKIKEGSAALVIGTHALFQTSVIFKQLGLIIIDEQHRFGVEQRLALRAKGEHLGFQPHQLIMTATPIPRTLAMTAYADLNLSIIDELPPGRTPIKTVVLDEAGRDRVIQRVLHLCEQGAQIYWVCPLITESELLECQAAEKCFEDLQKSLNGISIGLVHGRLKTEEKHAVMHAFKNGELQVLVATTVIEVGVNVPNASVMIIENAERLGLSQLHQLRGRVGRGSAESFCVLLYKNPLSAMTRSRLEVMRDTNDGFVIANKDLELRGPGEILGTRQTGLATLRIADLNRDQSLIPLAQDIATQILKDKPEWIPELISRWLPRSDEYGTA